MDCWQVVIAHRPVNKALATLMKAQLASFPSVQADDLHVHQVEFRYDKQYNKKNVKRLKGELRGETEGELRGGLRQRLRQWVNRRRGQNVQQGDLKVHIIVDEVEWL